MNRSQIAAQLYTCRDLLKTPSGIAKTLRRLRDVGYTAVEVAGLGPISDQELAKILDAEGLTVCSAHADGDKLLSDPAAVVQKLKILNCGLTAYPYPAGFDLTDSSSVGELIKKLDAAGAHLAAEGVTLTYHNHAMEFLKTDGVTVLDRIYGETDRANLQAELDTYWIHYGGGENAAWCRKLDGRLPIMHLKDYGFTAANKPTYCELGAGTLDFSAIVAAAEAAGCRWFVVEQDETPGDPVESLRQSFDHLTSTICGSSDSELGFS
ncbi:MAG: TIM barrel protein [Chthoniobacterales bacterium]